MNERMRQITAMFSTITGESMEDSLKIILQTETGKAVQENNMAVMYEQQTENLYEIAEELKVQKQYAETAELLSVENIIRAMRAFQAREEEKKSPKILFIQKEPELKGQDRIRLAAKRKNILQIKRQNQINEGRIKHVNRIEGQK